MRSNTISLAASSNFEMWCKSIFVSSLISVNPSILKNLLTDVELVFFEIDDKDKFIIEYQEDAKLLCKDIEKNLIP